VLTVQDANAGALNPNTIKQAIKSLFKTISFKKVPNPPRLGFLETDVQMPILDEICEVRRQLEVEHVGSIGFLWSHEFD
jgi:hypothetical protein